MAIDAHARLEVRRGPGRSARLDGQDVPGAVQHLADSRAQLSSGSVSKRSTGCSPLWMALNGNPTGGVPDFEPLLGLEWKPTGKQLRRVPNFEKRVERFKWNQLPRTGILTLYT